MLEKSQMLAMEHKVNIYSLIIKLECRKNLLLLETSLACHIKQNVKTDIRNAKIQPKTRLSETEQKLNHPTVSILPSLAWWASIRRAAEKVELLLVPRTAGDTAPATGPLPGDTCEFECTDSRDLGVGDLLSGFPIPMAKFLMSAPAPVKNNN